MTLEDRLALHCSAVFLRKKPAALFTLPKQELENETMTCVMDAYSLSFLTLCKRHENALVLVYDAAMLGGCLRGEVIRAALADNGYPAGGLQDTLAYLRERFSSCGAFPHEIGFFLGYPAEDVLGFMQHKGKRCKLCGLWKVYGDVGRATAMWGEFFACRDYVLEYLRQGGTLLDLSADLAG